MPRSWLAWKAHLGGWLETHPGVAAWFSGLSGWLAAGATFVTIVVALTIYRRQLRDHIAELEKARKDLATATAIGIFHQAREMFIFADNWLADLRDFSDWLNELDAKTKAENRETNLVPKNAVLSEHERKKQDAQILERWKSKCQRTYPELLIPFKDVLAAMPHPAASSFATGYAQIKRAEWAGDNLRGVPNVCFAAALQAILRLSMIGIGDFIVEASNFIKATSSGCDYQPHQEMLQKLSDLKSSA